MLEKMIQAQTAKQAETLDRWLEKRGMSAVNIFYSLCALSVCGLALAVCLARWA